MLNVLFLFGNSISGFCFFELSWSVWSIIVIRLLLYYKEYVVLLRFSCVRLVKPLA